MAPSECRVCGLPGKPCSRCGVDAYCERDHQLEDWPRHRAGCGALELLDAGRRLRAAKDVPKGTVLVREAPSVIFPVPQQAGAVSTRRNHVTRQTEREVTPTMYANVCVQRRGGSINSTREERRVLYP